ncbi:MAG TPA: CoA transferase [Solirubrobacteraceae bacterium]|nr:CoA transferase [Solirubrobacteraceae bacterium]
MAGALDGILVADFSRVLAGPLCTMTLGDLGADVVKVERPGAGDDTRQWGPPFVAEGSTYYLGLNRNKRSIVLDLKDAGDLVLARRLAARADVVVESFRPGTMERLGLGHEDVRAQNPGVVYCSVSAFGSGERAAGLPGYDLLLQAMSGLMSFTGEPDGRPLKVGVALIDMICGLYAANGILAALHARSRTGAGQRVEISLMDSALSALLNQGSAYLLAGVVAGRLGNRHPSIVPYETYTAADGDFAVATGNDGNFARLCEAIGRPDLPVDPRYATNGARLEHRDALGEELSAALAARPVAEWVELLSAAGVPAGPINDVAQAFAFAEELGLDPVDETDGVRTARSPLRLGATPAAVRRRPPRLGEHSAEIRAWLAADEG